jgi:hypothetical protein
MELDYGRDYIRSYLFHLGKWLVAFTIFRGWMMLAENQLYGAKSGKLSSVKYFDEE